MWRGTFCPLVCHSATLFASTPAVAGVLLDCPLAPFFVSRLQVRVLERLGCIPSQRAGVPNANPATTTRPLQPADHLLSHVSMLIRPFVAGPLATV